MRSLLTTVAAVFLILSAPSAALADEPIFEPTDHCVAYRTIKDMWFSVESAIVGKSCETTASLYSAAGVEAPRLSVVVPIATLDSDNRFRDGAVAELLGAEADPDLRFVSSPLDADALRSGLSKGTLVLPGVLSVGGKDVPVEFPFELRRHRGRLIAAGVLVTTFEAFDIEVPTVAGGLIARPHEGLEIAFQLELERVAGLEEWMGQQGLRLDGDSEE